MSAHPANRKILALVCVGAFFLAGGALYLAITEANLVGPLFRKVLTLKVMAALFIWFTAAWAARRFAPRKAQTVKFGQTWLVWGGTRVALLIATFVLLMGWLATLALGLALQTAFIRAATLLCVVTAYTGIAGGALMNSMVAIRHRRVEAP